MTTAPSPRILVIMLNWRQPETSLECVNTLLQLNQNNIQVDILVIDNGSGDGSAAKLRPELPSDVELLTLPDNVGFAAGSNVGMRQAIDKGYDFALLINNDAFPAPDMLTQLVDASTNDIALFCPKIYYESDPQQIWFAGADQGRWTLDMVNAGRGQPDGPQWSADRDVDYVLGTCLLVNLTAAERVGLLDERFFMYFEDLDWSIRFREAGYHLRLVAGAHLYHRVAVSSGGLETPFRRYHLARSGVLFWRKHLHKGNEVAIALFRAGSGVKMVTRLLLRGDVKGTAAYLRGLRDGNIIANSDNETQ